MAKEIERAPRRQRPLSVLSCRVESLEQISRVNGYAASDEILRAFADDIRQCLPPSQGWFARIAENRFVLVLPRIRFNGAQRLARKLRTRFAAVPVRTTAGSISCTASIAVTSCEPWRDWTPMHAASRH
jgi:PleD family two-component response regulator